MFFGDTPESGYKKSTAVLQFHLLTQFCLQFRLYLQILCRDELCFSAVAVASIPRINMKTFQLTWVLGFLAVATTALPAASPAEAIALRKSVL